MTDIPQKLNALGLTLPAVPKPGGSYVPYRRAGGLLYLAGVISASHGELTHAGKVGETQSIESGYAAARVCALNALAVINEALGGFEAVEQFLFMSGYVNAVPGFAESPKVINGASELFGTLFGEAGRHARAAVAVAGLPLDATVEIQVTLAVRA